MSTGVHVSSMPESIRTLPHGAAVWPLELCKIQEQIWLPVTFDASDTFPVEDSLGPLADPNLYPLKGRLLSPRLHPFLS